MNVKLTCLKCNGSCKVGGEPCAACMGVGYLTNDCNPIAEVINAHLTEIKESNGSKTAKKGRPKKSTPDN